jgi:hypothetical protein
LESSAVVRAECTSLGVQSPEKQRLDQVVVCSLRGLLPKSATAVSPGNCDPSAGGQGLVAQALAHYVGTILIVSVQVQELGEELFPLLGEMGMSLDGNRVISDAGAFEVAGVRKIQRRGRSLTLLFRCFDFFHPV